MPPTDGLKQNVQLLTRANPVVPTVIVDEDELSVKSDITLELDQPFYIIQLDKDGKAWLIEPKNNMKRASLVDTTRTDDQPSNRKRCRSKDMTPPRQKKQIVPGPTKEKELENQTGNNMWNLSTLEKFVELVEALLPMCAPATNNNASKLGSLKPWHSSSSMLMHHGGCRPSTPIHGGDRSYLATTVGICHM